MDTLQRIGEMFPHLSKGKQKIAKYILENNEEAAFSPAILIAKAVGMSESAVVRLANDLGFSGYREMQESLQKTLKERLSIVERIEHALKTDGTENSYLRAFEQDLININETIKGIAEEDFTKAVNMIMSAKRIGVAGIRAGVAPALVLQMYLNEMLNNVFLLIPGVGDAFDRIKTWGSEDLVIGNTFSIIKNYTYDTMKYAKSKGCKIITIADNAVNPAAQIADLVLPVKVNGNFVSYTAVMTVINTVLYLVSQNVKDKTIDSLRETENILRNHLPRGHALRKEG